MYVHINFRTPTSKLETPEILYGRVRHLYLKLVYDRRGCWIHFQQKIKIEMKPSHQTEHIYFLFSKFMKKDDF